MCQKRDWARLSDSGATRGLRPLKRTVGAGFKVADGDIVSWDVLGGSVSGTASFGGQKSGVFGSSGAPPNSGASPEGEGPVNTVEVGANCG
jgi:hypothetical protein